LPFPSETFVGQFASALQQVADELRAYYSQLTGYLAKEHNADGTHGDLTADAITLARVSSREVGGGYTFDTADAKRLGMYSDTDTGSRVLELWSETSEQIDATIFLEARSDRTSFAGDVAVLSLSTQNPSFSVALSKGGTNASFQLSFGSMSTTENFSAIGTFTERGRTKPMGEWTTVAFSAGNFTANGSMTWTVASGDVTTFQYRIVGKSLLITFYLTGGTVGGSVNNELRIAIPGGFTVNQSVVVPVRALNNGVYGVTLCLAAAGATVLTFYPNIAAAGNWTAGTVNMQGQIEVEIQ
jgi:hypothetical protein